jgi:(3R)-3-hydroxyacyl-CoA dehydrogenase / 3a,7a,12a-trihydroxy-5b-cholest-24-enoyl-CoA hydratase / enoyl-CoA hydratase 2
MLEQGYGRIIMTTSAAGLYGNFGQANYSSAKLGLLGFAQTLAHEGKKKNVFVNTIAPVAASRMTATVMPEDILKLLKPEYVSPLVGFLCSEDNKDVTGQCFEVGAGWIARVRWERSHGVLFPVDRELMPEDVKANYAHIVDFSAPSYPQTLQDSMGLVTGNLANKGPNAKVNTGPKAAAPAAPASAAAAPAAAAGGSVSVAGFKASAVMTQLEQKVKASGAALVAQIGGVYEFDIGGADGKRQSWTVDLKTGTGAVRAGKPEQAGVTLSLADDDFVSLMTGKLNAQNAFMQGKLKIKGNMALAMKLEALTKAQSKL